jgi:hypothetical protein
MTDKIKEKLKNKDFLKKMIGLETKEEVKKAFSEEGLEISEKGECLLNNDIYHFVYMYSCI